MLSWVRRFAAALSLRYPEGTGKRIMIKKIAAFILCVSAAGCLLLSGCTVSSSSSLSDETLTVSGIALDGTWPEETVLIGVEIYDAADEQTGAFINYLEYLTDYFNIQFMVSDGLDDAEAELAFIDSCAAAGCEAVIGYYNVSGSAAVEEIINNEMYYWGTQDFSEAFPDNDYYLGYCDLSGEDPEGNGDYLAGYELAYAIAQQGAGHVFCCSAGTEAFADILEGFEAGIAAARSQGCEIEYDPLEDLVEGWPGTEDFTAAVSAKLDGTYDAAAVLFGPSAVISLITDAGLAGSVAAGALCTVSDTYYDSVTEGTLTVVVYECEEVVFGGGIVQILNAVTGHADAARETDKSAGVIHVNRWVITDPDSFEAVYDYHESGGYFVGAADIANLLAEFNEDVTFEDIDDFYSSLDLEAGLAMAQ